MARNPPPTSTTPVILLHPFRPERPSAFPKGSMPDFQGKYTIGSKGASMVLREVTTLPLSLLSSCREAGTMMATAAQRRLQPSGVHPPPPRRRYFFREESRRPGIIPIYEKQPGEDVSPRLLLFSDTSCPQKTAQAAKAITSQCWPSKAPAAREALPAACRRTSCRTPRYLRLPSPTWRCLPPESTSASRC